MCVSEEESEIAVVLEDGLKSGQISIPGSDSAAKFLFSDIHSFTQYLQNFGTKIADRIKRCFPPIYNPAEEPISDKLREVNQYVMEHAGYALFDAQLGAAEALRRQLEKASWPCLWRNAEAARPRSAAPLYMPISTAIPNGGQITRRSTS